MIFENVKEFSPINPTLCTTVWKTQLSTSETAYGGERAFAVMQLFEKLFYDACTLS